MVFIHIKAYAEINTVICTQQNIQSSSYEISHNNRKNMHSLGWQKIRWRGTCCWPNYLKEERDVSLACAHRRWASPPLLKTDCSFFSWLKNTALDLSITTSSDTAAASRCSLVQIRPQWIGEASISVTHCFHFLWMMSFLKLQYHAQYPRSCPLYVLLRGCC